MRLYKKLFKDANWYFIALIMLMSNSFILSSPFDNIWAMIMSHSVISIFMITTYFYILSEMNSFSEPIWWIFSYVFESEFLIEQSQKDQIEIWCDNNCERGWRFWKDEYILFWSYKDALAFKLFWK